MSEEQSSWIDKVVGLFEQKEEDPQKRLSELIELIREFAKKNELSDQSLSMFEGVLRMENKKVRDVMIAKNQAIMFDIDSKMDEIVKLVIRSGHSRFPVLSADGNKALGVLLSKDLLSYLREDKIDEFVISKHMRKLLRVPESKLLGELLSDFQAERSHMAIVVDEFSSISGIVTIEDVLELITGDIEDEYDIVENKQIFEESPQSWLLDAKVELEEFDEFFQTDLKKDHENVDTIGGLILKKLGNIPKKGELINEKSMTFEVVEANYRRIFLVRLCFANPKHSEN